MKMTVRLGGPAAAIAVTAGVAASLAIAAGGSSQPTATVPTSPMQAGSGSAVESRPAAIDPTLKRAFGVLRRSRTAMDDFTPAAVARVDAAGDGQNPGLARRALTTASGQTWFVSPSARGLCAVDQTGGGGCTTTQDAIDGTFFGVDVCAPNLADKVRVYGLVPDGGSVTLQMADGSTTTPSVTNNFYSQEFPKTGPLPAKITSTANGRTTSRDLPLGPADSRSCVG